MEKPDIVPACEMKNIVPGTTDQFFYDQAVPRLWVAVLDIDDDVRRKIDALHFVTWQEVRGEVVTVSGLNAWKDEDDQRGLRWYVKFWIRNHDYLAVLRPDRVDTDRYKLLTCYEI